MIACCGCRCADRLVDEPVRLARGTPLLHLPVTLAENRFQRLRRPSGHALCKNEVIFLVQVDLQLLA